MPAGMFQPIHTNVTVIKDVFAVILSEMEFYAV